MANDINVKPFTVIYDWMIDKDCLELDCTSAMVFAIIYSFTKSKAGCYYGNREYIAKKIGKSTRTVTTIINSLVSKELVMKTVQMEGCIKHNTLTANVDLVEKILENQQHSRVKKLHSTAEETSLATAEKTSLNNKQTYNKQINNKITTKVVEETSNSTKQTQSNNSTATTTSNECVSEKDMNVAVTDTDDLGLKDNVLVEKKKTKKKKNRYEKCIDIINDFTEDEKVRECLVGYLNMILEKSRSEGKNMFPNQFKGRLTKLKLNVPVEDWIESITNATCGGWYWFYPVKNDYSKVDTYKKFSESPQSHNSFESEEAYEERMRFAKENEKNGRTSVF